VPVTSAPPPSPAPTVGAAAAVAPSTAVPDAGGAFAARPGTTQPGATQLLQVAAVKEIARGRDLQRQLRAAGFDAYWESVRMRGADVVRVRISVDPATQSVAETLTKLKAMGFDPILVSP
jgi:cell division septation protein DedD